MANFTPTEGQYLSFLHNYMKQHGGPPADPEIAEAMYVMTGAVKRMLGQLEKKGLIQREPGEPRGIRILVPEDQIPA